MSDWIEINLPYTYYGDSGQDCPDLSEKGKKVFGFSVAEARAMLLGDKQFLSETDEGNHYFEELDKARDHLQEKNIDVDSDEGKLVLQDYLDELALKDEAVQSVLSFVKFQRQWDEWYNSQPEMLQWFEDNKVRRQEDNKKSFSGLGLNVPGTLIEIENDGGLKQYLIGDINTSRGVCDDCCEFDRDTIIKRYKIVWRPDVLDDNQGKA